MKELQTTIEIKNIDNLRIFKTLFKAKLNIAFSGPFLAYFDIIIFFKSQLGNVSQKINVDSCC